MKKSNHHHRVFPTVLCTIMIMALAGASAPAQELVRNGTFMGNYNGWDYYVLKEYLADQAKPRIDARGEGVVISNLTSDNYHAANAIRLSQAVNVEQDKRYRFTCEVKSGEGQVGRFTVAIHAPFWGASWDLLGNRQEHMKKQYSLTDQWLTISEEFVGKFGPGDIKEMVKTMRDGIKNHPEWDSSRKKRETGMIHWNVKDTQLELWFAKGHGEIQVRNVSLQVVP